MFRGSALRSRCSSMFPKKNEHWSMLDPYQHPAWRFPDALCQVISSQALPRKPPGVPLGFGSSKDTLGSFPGCLLEVLRAHKGPEEASKPVDESQISRIKESQNARLGSQSMKLQQERWKTFTKHYFSIPSPLFFGGDTISQTKKRPNNQQTIQESHPLGVFPHSLSPSLLPR